jgi:hypothetical protein
MDWILTEGETFVQERGIAVLHIGSDPKHKHCTGQETPRGTLCKRQEFKIRGCLPKTGTIVCG